MQASTQTPALLPWWQVGTMWLVIGGLAVVVVGSFALAFAAWHGADTVVLESLPSGRPVGTAPNTPALQGRNHAATPAVARQ
jgi:hypothetical protein